ncbi:MAG: sigma-70 family RNA polymerase sigma factor [Sphingomonadaceae bacterium]|nr:sigma-70 family RNA polymerase sigma factor [Sphingomonadaceae bacterium]
MSADDETLSKLMALAQHGDKRAYRQLLFECETWLKRYYARKIGAETLDDLVQETLMSLHRKRATYDAERPFLPWLAAIARYRWIDHLRKAYRKKEVAELNEEIAADPHDPAIGARLGVEKLLRLIPEKQALAIQLVKIEGLSIAEASAQSGQSESAVKVNIHRGIKRMSAAIEEG